MRTDLVVQGTNLSEAWARTVAAVAAEPSRRAAHVVTRIADPVSEDQEIRVIADGILNHAQLAPIETVANTLFPASLAKKFSDPKRLGERYVELMPRLRNLDRQNRHGTYFGRLVDYPTAQGSCNQLAELVRKLTVESAKALPSSKTGPITARYEVGFELPSVGVPIQQPSKDTEAIGFPCLSLLSFQFDQGRVHAAAHYRSHYLFERAYGNYLAVGRLLRYICASADLAPGEVTIFAAYAQVDHYRVPPVRALTDYLASLDCPS